jgi:RNA polymerase sigma-70 factor (ECF subfamily)
MDAWERGDVDALAALLAEDATFAMPPYASWWRWDPERGRYAAEALEVLTLEGTQVKEMTAFMTPQLFPRFGLPETLSPDVG